MKSIQETGKIIEKNTPCTSSETDKKKDSPKDGINKNYKEYIRHTIGKIG